MLREAETEPVRGKGRQDSAPRVDKGEPDTRLVGQEPYDGVLYYVQIGFLGSRKPLNDRVFKSYRNRVTEKRTRTRIPLPRGRGAGLRCHREDTVRGPEGVSPTLSSGHEGDKRMGCKDRTA